ncbi:MAG: DUF2782 domain-containing protein [Burkholderiales bacterium]|nr:DUF2782 domain-containing protein [Burkholderiales bacterium]
MRKLSLVPLLLVSLAALADATPPKVDVPPPPPPPASVPDDNGTVVEPEVTIVQKDDATITEYRVGGKLYMEKVQPKVGPAYYLVDDVGAGHLIRRDSDPTVRPPMWVIKRF